MWNGVEPSCPQDCPSEVVHDGLIYSCEDAALQVLMYVCVCVRRQVEILPSYSIQNVPECSIMLQNVAECCRMFQNNNVVL